MVACPNALESKAPDRLNQKLGVIGLFLFAGFGWFAKTLALLGLGLMVLAFLMDWAKVGAVVRRDPVFFAALGLFFVYLLLATVRGNYEFPQMDDRDAMVEWLSLSLFVCVAWWLRGDSRRMLTVISLAFAGFVIGILWNWNGEVTARVLGGDRDGFGRAIPVSALYSATAVLGLLVLAARFWGSHVPRWMFVSKIVVWGALLALMLQLLITTQSRITWIAALVVFPIVLLARLGATVRHRMSLRVIVPLSLLAFGVVAVVIYRNIDTLSLRVNYENQAWAGVARWDLDEIPIETAVGARAHLWYYGAGRWMERPLFGWGPSTQVTRLATSPISQYSHLHNTYLEILVRFGLVGAVLLMVLLFLIVRSVWRARQRGALSHDYFLFIAGSLAILAIWSIANFRMPVDWRFFWCLLAGMAYGFEFQPAAADATRYPPAPSTHSPTVAPER